MIGKSEYRGFTLFPMELMIANVSTEDDFSFAYKMSVVYYGKDGWSLVLKGNMALNKNSMTFDIEPLPSRRTDEYTKSHRFKSQERALDFLMANCDNIRDNLHKVKGE